MKRLDLWAGALPIGRTVETLLVASLLAILFALGGCANEDEYFKAMQAKYEADGKLAVAKAMAEGKKWDALTAGATTDVGKAVLGIVAAVSEVKGGQTAPVAAGDSLKPPRDGVDTFLAFVEGLTRAARVGVDLRAITETGATRRAEIAGNVEMRRIDGQTQVGLVEVVAKNGGTHVTAGGDAVAGSGTVDKRDCKSIAGQAGNGAAGGAGAAGGTATTGSANAAPGAAGGTGGAGGTAGGNCGP